MFVLGVTHGLAVQYRADADALGLYGGELKRPYCLPEGITGPQIVDAVKANMMQGFDPQELAAITVRRAIGRAFPCP